MLALLVLVCSDPVAEPLPMVQAAALATLDETLEPGSLIFSEGACLYVTAYTGSATTHVAIADRDADGTVMIYDSMKGFGVRRSTLAHYLDDMNDATLRVLHPTKPLSDRARARLHAALEDDLGRPYSVAHYLTGRRATGVHCSEYATHSLREAGLVRCAHPANVSPGGLAKSLEAGVNWRSAGAIALVQPQPVKPEGLNCCEDFWWETGECCRQTGDWLTGLFLCR